MGNNKLEKFGFSLITCVLMVFIMSWYNGFLESGLKINFIKTFILFFPICVIAFIIDWFIVGNIVKLIAGKILNPNDPLVKKILIMTFLMVFGMATAMSLLSTIAHGHIGEYFFIEFIKTWLKNFPFALILNLFIVGPTARAIFLKIFPQQIVRN